MSHTLGTGLDYAVMAAYFVAIMALGSLFGRHSRSTRDYFFAGQRFSWWLVAMSMVATLVGSYSFVKYSAKGFQFGLSSSMAYLNDWVWLPLFALGWLPLLYFSGVRSIPEYFERRFDRRTRVAATAILLLYMVGYLGINFYTLGVAFNRVVGWDVFPTAAAIALATAVYVTAGGQAAVIMTDLFQGFLLLSVGVAVLIIGWLALGDGEIGSGLARFWNDLTPAQRQAFPSFNHPPGFNFVGIFWQDGFANTVFFYFLNQGIIMRFLAVRSQREARKAALATVLFLVPLAALAVSSAGWLGPSLVKAGLVPADTAPRDIFVAVAHALTQPGVFGLLLAALAAALMSSADSLINAVAAVFLNDIYQPFLRPGASETHYLRVARVVSFASALVGIALVPVFMSFESIYRAHGAFTAAVTPPMVVAVLAGFLWPGFSARAAFWTLVGGTAASAVSFVWPELITPFAQGTPMEAGALKAYSYVRALYGLTASAAIGVLVTLIGSRGAHRRHEGGGLVLGSLAAAMQRFKGGEPHPGHGAWIHLESAPVEAEDGLDTGVRAARTPDTPKERRSSQAPHSTAQAGMPGPERIAVRLSEADQSRLGASPGDLLFVSHPGWWHGGLLGVHARLVGESPGAQPHSSPFAVAGEEPGRIQLPQWVLGRLRVSPGRLVRVELIL